MPRKYEKTTRVLCDNITRYRILSKGADLTNKDIRVLKDGCSMQSASNYIAKIKLWVATKKGIVLNNGIPPEWFCEYMKWDFAKIQKFAFDEIALLSKNKVQQV